MLEVSEMDDDVIPNPAILNAHKEINTRVKILTVLASMLPEKQLRTGGTRNQGKVLI